MADLDYEHMSFKEMLKHAKRGDEWAQYLVGLEYAYPENDDDVNEKKAVKWFRKASDAGVPEASFHLAFMMYLGDGTEMDKEGAYNLILKTAMESDLADAWGLLGFMYGNGDCVKQDLDRFQRAFEGTVPQFATQIGAPGERSAGFGAVRDAVRGSARDIGDVESGERGKQTRTLQWKRIQRSTASSESPSSAFQ